MSHLPLPFYLTGDFIAHLPLSANDCKLINGYCKTSIQKIFLVFLSHQQIQRMVQSSCNLRSYIQGYCFTVAVTRPV